MKKLMPLLLSAVLLSNAVACQKSNEPIGKTSAPANQSNASSGKLKNQAAAIPAGTSFDTILQQDLSTGKNRNNERFTLRVKGGDKTLKDAVIQGHLEDVVKAAKGKKASLHLVFDDIKLANGAAAPLDVTLVNTQVETKTKGKFVQNAGIILAGAVAGKFVGDKAKFKHGTLAGGAAATAYVLSSPGGEVVLKKGTNVKLKLKKPLDTSP
ncbi:MAG: hypothetical protein JGK24_11795 [Microcoleus sp. PH2017_29_MFU_D_A]|uniref:hypothetical protein n=2 Tax=unclassified Microcoleus TaxID=2642155 RepID=UPI001DD05A51|nr:MULTISPECIES: hypothetical protein [unclassified Microcoleus]MCC3465070.1 hypothetical protein [Microcoleus sp. PH2017_06_SFM_O_A]MCC3504034.1 hypothetical protein [Microcoleus sp. PH2017_19_SFW_U_A]MCC3629578.1 hypothetical protein [Microcoleus sp. PH2017_39_LGB_O_B]TAE13510.1 MAG: hypothetical protein EAZ94_09575 [Oscillatoriales cyanobacterium]MCC3448568.1 hypothetical protein [Microcoleus sp. PH2017_09_SFU_O_A]